jgi:hypothetical protein
MSTIYSTCSWYLWLTMLVKKIFTTRLDILDPTQLYRADIDAVIMDMLKRRYEHRCYMSMVVIEITRVINKSLVMMSDNKLDAAGYINVEFEASGVVFVQGEVITGASITMINANAIMAKHEYAHINVKKDARKIISALSVGQVIPMVVDKALYNPNQTAASVSASPYVPAVKENYYFAITKGLSEDEIAKLETLEKDLVEEKEKHKALKGNKAYEYFENFLSPYKVDPKFRTSSLASKLRLVPVNISVEDMKKLSGGMCMYPSEENKKNGVFYHTAGTPALPDVLYVSAYAAFAAFINEYMMYLQALRGLVETYPTPNDLQPILGYLRLCSSERV